MRPIKHAAAILLLAALLPAQIPTPEEVVGFRPGTAGELAGYDRILAYFRALARASERVHLEVVGRTTRDLPFAVVTISSPENLARRGAIRAANLRLADPRELGPGEAEALIEKGRTIVVVNESLHSSEVGPSQAGMVTAHFLATTRDPEWLEVLDRVLVVLVPCHNPDGYEVVVDWWYQNRDDPERRGAPLPELYHEYTGHDNNRDWFMLTQQETRLTIKHVYMHWKPQIVVDQHQMGGSGARMFVPPYIEPYEPNVHPLIKERLEELGRFVLERMTESGRRGVWCRHQFDAWTPARAFQHYHGAVRFLTEVASCRWADPVTVRHLSKAAREQTPDNPAPWKRGEWTLADVVDYCSQGVLQVLRHASEDREAWLRAFHRIHRDNVEGVGGPAGFLIPVAGQEGCVLDKLLDVMALGGVEVRRSEEPCDVEGRSFPAGQLLIPGGQPYFCFARALLENTRYPEIRSRPGGPIRRPYDVTCHNLPLLMNLEVLPVPRGSRLPRLAPEVLDSPLEELPATPTRIHEPMALLGDGLKTRADVLRAMHAGHGVRRTTKPVSGVPGGSFVVVPGEGGFQPRARARRVDPEDLECRPLRRVRLGLYMPWLASMDEGWTRFLLDTFGVPYRRLRNEAFHRGDLGSRADVILLASYARRDATRAILQGRRSHRLPPRYRGGLGKEGADALRSFVEQGGTLVALNSSSSFALHIFDLPLEQVDTGSRVRPGRDGRPRFRIPGAMLACRLDPASDLTTGLPRRLPAFFWRGRAFRLTGEGEGPRRATLPVTWAEEDLVAGGWAEGAGLLAGHGAVADVRVGRGRVILFGFSPQFRCQTWGTFPLLFNALLAAAEPAEGD